MKNGAPPAEQMSNEGILSFLFQMIVACISQKIADLKN
jgi:hypothetical protein